MTDTHEFASPGWLTAICDIVDKTVAASGVDLAGIDYTLGEEFYNVPSRLNPTGADRVGWVVRVRGGVVESASEVPPMDADSNNIADWDAIEHLAHHVFGLDPDRDAAVAQEAATLEADGKLQRVVRTPRPPALTESLGGPHALHNAVVAMTAPRQS